MNENPPVIEYAVERRNTQTETWQRIGGPWRDTGPDNTTAKSTAFEDLRLWREFSTTNEYRVVQIVSITSVVCETCSHPMHRQTVGMVCPDCGTDYSSTNDQPVPLGEWKIEPPQAGASR